MNNLDKFRYSYDDPSQLNISLKKNPYEKINDLKSNNLNQLLSTSVKVTKEIFPDINKAIENVFKRLKIENNLNFFVTANHIQTQAMCCAMPLGDSAEIILTSKLIELLNGEELESVIAHEVAHFYYQHALYPQANSSTNRVETLNLLNFSRAAEISADRIGFIACVWMWLAVTKKFKLLLIFRRLKTFSIALLISGNISLVTFTEVERS